MNDDTKPQLASAEDRLASILSTVAAKDFSDWWTTTIRDARAELINMREALEPFAKCAAAYDGYEGDQVNYYRARRYVVDQLTVGDFRKARAAIAPSPAEEKSR